MSQQNKLMGVGQSAASAAQIVGDVASGLTAAGTGQTTALALSCACNYVETVSSGTGVRLYGSSGRPSSIGDEQTVYNTGANTLSVYPPSGEQIVGAAQDAAFSVPVGVAVTFKKVKNTLWLVVSGDAAFERFIQSGTAPLYGFATRTAAAKMGDFYSVKDFKCADGAAVAGDGAHDDTTGIQSAVTWLSSGGTLIFPRGTYLITDAITIANHRVRLIGEGKQATIVSFVPTSTKSCFKFTNGASVLYQCAVRGFGFNGSNGQTKTAIDALDTSELRIDDVATYPWTGGSSIGIALKGRELTHISDISISADIPIKVSDNANSTIDCDHLHLEDIYLLPASTQPGITIDSGVNVTNLLIDGDNAVVGGTGIIDWNDSATAAASANVSLKNIRFEQATVGTTYMVRISHNYSLQNLRIENVYGGLNTRGFYLRNVNGAQFENTIYLDTAKEAFNANGTCNNIGFVNCLWQSGSTASTSGLTQKLSLHKTNAGSPLPDTGYFVNSATTGGLDALPVGATTPSTGKFTTLQATTGASIGGVTDTSIALWVNNISLTGQTSQYGTLFGPTFGTGATASATVFYAGSGNAAGSYTIPSYYQFYAANPSKGAGSTITTAYGYYCETINVGATNYAIYTNAGLVRFGGSVLQSQGAAVASANNLVLGADGNRFQISGTTQINLIDNTNWQGGATVTLHFQGSVTVKHNQAASGNNKPIKLSGSVDFSAAVRNQLTLQYDSTDAIWYEIARTVA